MWYKGKGASKDAIYKSGLNDYYIKERGKKMKKRLLAIALCALSVFSLAACDDKKDAKKRTYAELELGQYKGIEVDSSLKEVPEKDVEEYLQSVLDAHATTEEVKEGVVFAKDDAAKLSFKCTIDGKEYKSQEGVNVELTEDGFDIDGFVDSVIGKKPGDKYEVTLKIPKDFSDTTVAEKDAVFSVTLEAKINVIVPEFTDDFVAKNFEYLNLKNKEDMMAYLERDLWVVQIYNEIFQEIVDNAKVKSYDSVDLEEATEEFAEQMEYYIYSMTGGYTLDQYLALTGQSEDDFMKEMENYAKDQLKAEMVYEAIAKAEGIEVTDEIFEQKKIEFSKTYGYDTVEEFWKEYTKSMTEEDFKFTVLTYLVQDAVCDAVVYVDGLGLRNEEESSSGENESSSEKESSKGESESTSKADEK